MVNEQPTLATKIIFQLDQNKVLNHVSVVFSWVAQAPGLYKDMLHAKIQIFPIVMSGDVLL
jgi:hypothetical protein